MRQDDAQSFGHLRQPRNTPRHKIVLAPGSVLIPNDNLAVIAVVASAVVVTMYDRELKHGGLCHFIRAMPPAGQSPRPVYGLAACAALLNGFLELGSSPANLWVGLYGGAIPEWANATQREVARGNIEVVRDVMQRKGVRIEDEDVGGSRARKLLYQTASNEIAVVKTMNVRNNDWFPAFKDIHEKR